MGAYSHIIENSCFIDITNGLQEELGCHGPVNCVKMVLLKFNLKETSIDPHFSRFFFSVSLLGNVFLKEFCCSTANTLEVT